LARSRWLRQGAWPSAATKIGAKGRDRFPAGSPGGRTGLLRAALALRADVLHHAGIGGDLGQHGVGVGEQALVGAARFRRGAGLVVLLAGHAGIAVAVPAGAGDRLLGVLRGKIVDAGAAAGVGKALAAGIAIGELDGVEIAGDGRFGLVVGGVYQPHHEEEAHHRGHEIGEGDLPYAAVMAVVVVVMVAPHDDDLVPGLGSLGDAHDRTSERAAAHSDCASRTPRRRSNTARSKPAPR